MTLIEFFSNHTYRMVFFGTTIVGITSGALGCFAYLRRQSLASDVISHAALPGSLIAFLVSVSVLNVDGRNLVGLLIGALSAGTLAVLFANYVSARSKIAIDTAMAISLTLFFGVGMLLLRIITQGSYRGKGGIADYLFGNASVITKADIHTSLIVGGLTLAITALCWKEFALRTFDPDQTTVLGLGGRRIDFIMFTAISAAVVIGVKAVGLVLMVAFIVTPPAAARQWVESLSGLVFLSAFLGGLGSAIGSYLSIAWGKVPTGPLIVVTLFVFFVISLLAAPKRSVLVRAWQRRTNRAKLLAEIGLAK